MIKYYLVIYKEWGTIGKEGAVHNFNGEVIDVGHNGAILHHIMNISH